MVISFILSGASVIAFSPDRVDSSRQLINPPRQQKPIQAR
ncbi:hypothetical protein RCH23_003489 [Cryobacterium sp. CAN_C3]|nr:hypothetical protein [Cryobacterium sp. CAN_C3]